MIAGIGVDSGFGALLLCSAFSAVVVGAVAVIAPGFREVRRRRRDGLAALGRIWIGGDR